MLGNIAETSGKTKTARKKMVSHDLTQSDVRDLLEYDPETGIFRWRVDRTGGYGAVIRAAGTVACRIKRGRGRSPYRTICIDGRQYYAHRLAWLYVHGRWPVGDLDHIDGDGANNRLGNLREATRSQNLGNARLSRRNTSGMKGVSWDRSSGKWRARIRVAGEYRYLGLFETIDAAAAAYEAAADEGFGEFASKMTRIVVEPRVRS